MDLTQRVLDEIEATLWPTPIDVELSAMQSVVDALGTLDIRACRRLLWWVNERFTTVEPDAFIVRADTLVLAAGVAWVLGGGLL